MTSALTPDVSECRAVMESILNEWRCIRKAGVIAGACGPISYAVAMLLRERGYPTTVVHVFGNPACTEDSFAVLANNGRPVMDTGHFIVRCGNVAIDCSFRQFDPEASDCLVYDYALVGFPDEDNPHCPWDEVDYEFGHDQARPIPAAEYEYLWEAEIVEMYDTGQLPDRYVRELERLVVRVDEIAVFA